MSNLKAIRGDDEIYELTLKQADGTALNPTGALLWFTVKRGHDEIDTQALVRKTIANGGITIIDAATGRANVRILAVDLISLPPRRSHLVWDCQIKDAAGLVSTLDGGSFTVEPDVTQATS